MRCTSAMYHANFNIGRMDGDAGTIQSDMGRHVDQESGTLRIVVDEQGAYGFECMCTHWFRSIKQRAPTWTTHRRANEGGREIQECLCPCEGGRPQILKLMREGHQIRSPRRPPRVDAVSSSRR